MPRFLKLLIIWLGAFVLVGVGATAHAGSLYLKSCTYYSDQGLAYGALSNGSYSLSNSCPQGRSFEIDTSYGPKQGESARWQVGTPASITITAAYTPLNQVLIDPTIKNDGYVAQFYWNGGQQTITPTTSCCGGMDYGLGINRTLGPSKYFGWSVDCVSSAGCVSTPQLLAVRGIDLEGEDDTAPALTAAASPNLWNEANAWIRGSWPLAFQASDDSGVCSMSEIVAGQTLQGPLDTAPSQSSWQQCPSPQQMSQLINTQTLRDGMTSVQLRAQDAASPANVAAPTENVGIDNQPVSLTLTGPTDATSSPQYITARASAGPSGLSAIKCSTDNGPWTTYTGQSQVQLAVQGLGEHQVSCLAQNNAAAPDGSLAQSPLQTFTMTIRQPTLASAGFESIVDPLRCARRRKRLEIPAHWGVAVLNGKRVRVRVPAQRRRVTVVQCHPRVLKRRVRVRGHWKTIRTILLPHWARTSFKVVRHGSAAAVSGWLGTAAGTALAGQPVFVYTAPDNGQNAYTLAATATTRSDGGWNAAIPAGPSRVIEAVFAGSSSLEPVVSPSIRLSVPAQLSLRVKPRRTHWGSTVRITGRLAGGYIPPSGEMVVLWIGWKGGHTEIGHVYAHADGRFSTPYTFLRGNGTEGYRLWASSARESDYPYTSSVSRQVKIIVAG